MTPAIRSKTPREVLNEIRFREMASPEDPDAPRPGLDEAVITILHRAGPESRPTHRRILGPDVLRIERGFFYLRGDGGETAVPYHRVRSIQWKGEEIWRRG